MSRRFYTIPIEQLFKWILSEEKEGSIFGIYNELFFNPKANDPFRIKRYGRMLETPIGVAAGPHTQLSQNIIASWLMGARYIELKTVQTLDEIEVTKPCIDMEDEGYNCEWSQELKIEESFDEYLNAWIIIHILKDRFGWRTTDAGFIFNISVGYDLKGIKNANVQWFLDKMNDCSAEKEEKIKKLEPLYPGIRRISIPDCISDNVTLSTMHGCPAGEIESICRYLIEERKLHTTLKLNPTLLGNDNISKILNDDLGYEITVPDEAFDHDLQYEDAVKIIKSLGQIAENNKVEFGLKLTNTLESLNSSNWLPEQEKRIYLSGRALHPISINLAEKLQTEFNGELDISFSAGIDAFNAADTLSCNIKPLTVCSDILKPGGYLRLPQYMEQIGKAVKESGQNSIDDFIKVKGDSDNIYLAGLSNLQEYASSVLSNKLYQKDYLPDKNIKTNRELTEYDCIHAPCIEECAVSQNIPEYMYHTAHGNFEEAYTSILKENPLPNMTGNVCDHLCQIKCTRINYDNPILIREIKRFVAEKFENAPVINIKSKNGKKAAVIGAGPSGLSFAYFLAIEGFEVGIYESKPSAGGMVSGSIPYFRLNDKSVENDLNILKAAGVEFHYNQKVDEKLFSELSEKNDYIYIGIGAQESKKLNIPGEELSGVIDQLTFLSKVRRNESVKLGERVAVIGGGLSAIDAARTARRLVGKDGTVTMLYRRTKNEMPAGDDEITALLEEGTELVELTTPVSFHPNTENTLTIECVRMQLGEKDNSGRHRPVVIEGSNFTLEFDNIITAIGQDVVLDFVPGNRLIVNEETNETQFPKIFAGGDAIRGADSLINAMGDGKRAAEFIIEKVLKTKEINNGKDHQKLSPREFQKKLGHREYGIDLPKTKLSQRKGFDLVNPALSTREAVEEADRCLFCNDVCNICVSVCPNFANIGFIADPVNIPVYTVINNKSEVRAEITNSFNITQKNQILTIGNFCNECGNCNTFCPTSGAPYKTKPLFFLTEDSFSKETKGYYYGDGALQFKNNGSRETVSLNEKYFIYDSDLVSAKLSRNDFKILEVQFKDDSVGEVNLNHAAEMCFLAGNLKNIAIFKK